MGRLTACEDRSWRTFHTPTPLARSLFYYVQSAGHLWATPDYRTERRGLNSMLLVYTCRGKGYLEYRRKTYVLEPGQGFLINCMDHQVYHTDPEDLWEIIWLHFNGSESAGYVEQIYQTQGPVFPVPKTSVILEHIRRIHEMLNKKDLRLDVLGSCLIVQILTELLLLTSHREDRPTLPAPVELAINQIEAEYNQSFRLDELAKSIGMSKYHLSRLFKKHTGFSPYEYLLNQRLTRGKALLLHTSLSIEEIALRVGFNSSSHFIRMFRKYENLTPLQFRKQAM
ncbi:MAG TPA: AraC family transcriptional regulator [Firmicutes bacterium]|nr:AraC family transcriptional regulator [Bacillota bacterium]